MTVGRHLDWDGFILDTLTEVDVLAHLRDGGLSDADMVAVRQRLLDPLPRQRT